MRVMQHPFCFRTFYSQVESSNAHAQLTVLNFEQKRKKGIVQDKLEKEAKASCPIAREDTELERIIVIYSNS
jgi:hypothetical protein